MADQGYYNEGGAGQGSGPSPAEDRHEANGAAEERYPPGWQVSQMGQVPQMVQTIQQLPPQSYQFQQAGQWAASAGQMQAIPGWSTYQGQLPGGSFQHCDPDHMTKKQKVAADKAAKFDDDKPKKPKRETGFTKTYKLSPELAEIMGADAMPRHEVVKRMWAIIKERNLYDPKNKQFAICDDQLMKVFGVERFRAFGMMKYLKSHILETENTS
ncbi:unnamed protein product [Notodromas monacha]|uniref:DM2 domain-containing protein n=1 Tax=Notodromas monacha TaxID=399045 RepID=A0A7R9GBF6_9CRUS|nr:unnamed protein product [Notodromas monacha]CAG0916307.1 unnamed protein product [Notodromas monacha]